MELINEITKWQQDRKLDESLFDYKQSLYNFLEELFEGLGFPEGTDKILAIKYQALILDERKHYELADCSNSVVADSRCDMIVFAIGDLLKLKYSPSVALHETLLEISSRLQDPQQEAEWANGNRKDGEKWQKDKQQDPNTLYTADYSRALAVQDGSIKQELEEMRKDLLG